MTLKELASSKSPKPSSQPSSMRIRVFLLEAPFPMGEGQRVKLEVDDV